MLIAPKNVEQPFTQKCLVVLNQGSETLDGTMYTISSGSI